MYEILINICLFFTFFIIGSITNFIYFTEYNTGYTVIQPKIGFVMEGLINDDLFKTSEADFQFFPPSDNIVLPRTYASLKKGSTRL